MNIFLRELKANRKALIIWSVCMFLLVASGMGKYTVYSSSGQNNELFNNLPYSLKALLGFGSFDVTTMSGYFAVLFLYIELVAAIHAVLLGSNIIAKEERDKTTEFLITKPVSRTTIITSKFLAALVNIFILNIVSLLSSIVMVDAYNNGKDISGEIFMFILSMFIVQLIFLSIGMLLAAFIRKSKVSGSISVSVLLISFIISKITDLTDRLNVLNILSPFKYFSYKDLVAGKGLNFGVFLLSIVLIGIFSFSTYFFYRKRDLNV
ncbi:ABC transporter, permease protein [Clostridium pasteurianum DSM 525 = ATCC 6013]|uniref:ABC transporter, permease protein n=1 Tax=Clostridium pasteurianum DSM 525 = ATCC 6013 TaxID=1262449 RepID=A0A0H3J6G2_CLOPA|nr:ABC transporter permease subunit [Clostridium pasteurianum]AJA49039.1 ABC transporter, permease protein [Clostridium pasteurianum DSM 525 = ATCC 6013]AJA53027.1 ABC transporter, permease protein [Clostridium pasteurianum DSM 525 = ATCC 6013]AOZ76244.1 ABC transporter [Clostridium pasteurianum DSM 525 = ATCC 6013]AOZ80040.1 ABC transporter [Clostridium pasteurianum]ELP60335.1 ABC transporter, permease protein [Clostridium pasteurianum DSM 525 = ATCC 6013]